MEGQWGGGGFLKGRSCPCEIIFPEVHAKLAILEDLLTKK